MSAVPRFVGALLFLALVCGYGPQMLPRACGADAGERENLLVNGTFEKGIEGWSFHSFTSKGQVDADPVEKRAGKPSVRIDNAQADDSFLTQKVVVKPRTKYRLTGWIKTKAVGSMDKNSSNGASLAIKGGFLKSDSVTKNSGWKKVNVEFTTNAETEVELGPRLGHHGANVSGTAWFADLELVELGPTKR